MKRDPRLRDLSSEHHLALVVARDLGGERARLGELPTLFAAEIEPHFRVEEEWLLPPLEAAGEVDVVRRTREDHAYLRERVPRAASGDEHAIGELAQRLTEHVRFEERELFPRAEAALSGEALDRVAAAARVRVKRAYDPATDDDGYRVLVERLWPRGVRKESLRLDAWLKDVSPSPDLRKWFAHDVEKWEAFVARYRDELGREPAAGALAELVERAASGPVALVYGARDREHNSATVLRSVILERLAER